MFSHPHTKTYLKVLREISIFKRVDSLDNPCTFFSPLRQVFENSLYLTTGFHFLYPETESYIFLMKCYYKGHMDKIKQEGGGGGGRWVQLGWGGGMGRKSIQL